MAASTISSREFNQDVSRAKRLANEGPVVITDHGRNRYVLVTYAEFERLSKSQRSLLDMLAFPDVAEIDIEFEPLTLGLRPAKLD